MWDWIHKVQSLKKQNEAFVLVTVVKCLGSTPRNIGARMIVSKKNHIFGTIGGGNLEQQAREDALKYLKESQNKVSQYPLCAKSQQCCGGEVELMYEILGDEPDLYLFGAGHVGHSVCQVLQGTPFKIHLIDSRSEWINSEELPDNIIKHEGDWQKFVEKNKFSYKKTYAVVMTHSHEEDYNLIQFLIQKPAQYIGLIGSKTKWSRFKMKMEKEGIIKDKINRVTSPIGLAIGGKAPKEVAISLAAEILKIYYGK